MKDGKVLLSKRNSKRKEWQKWEVPGGIVEFGESVEDAVKREVKEELGIDIEILQPLDYIFSNIWKLEDEQIHVVLVGYLCRIRNGIPKPSDIEVEKVEWFTPEEVEKLECLPGTKEFVRKAFEKIEKEGLKVQ